MRPRGIRAQPPPASGEDSDAVVLSVALVSGHFESSITVPINATDAERQAFIEAWLNLMDAGIKVGKEHRDRKAPAE